MDTRDGLCSLANTLKATILCSASFFAVHTRFGEDVSGHLNIEDVKRLDQKTLADIQQIEIKFQHACEQSIVALVLWLASSGQQDIELCEKISSAAQDYIQTQPWQEDELLVLHYVLKTFACYFPLLTLQRFKAKNKNPVAGWAAGAVKTVLAYVDRAF